MSSTSIILNSVALDKTASLIGIMLLEKLAGHLRFLDSISIGHEVTSSGINIIAKVYTATLDHTLLNEPSA